MKKLAKIEQVKRWLLSGKSLTQHQAKVKFNYERLAAGIHRLRERGIWIIDIGKPGGYAKYILLERGPIKNLMIKGFRLSIEGAYYRYGFHDMEILIHADNGLRQRVFRCNSDAFRDKKIMEKHIENAK